MFIISLGREAPRKSNTMNNSEVQVYSNDSIDLPVKEVDGQVYFDAEASAIGLGITQVKNGKEYVQWKRVNNYLNNVSAHVRKEENSQHVGKKENNPNVTKCDIRQYSEMKMLPRRSKSL